MTRRPALAAVLAAVLLAPPAIAHAVSCAAPPGPSGGCPGVRPGARLLVGDQRHSCLASFLLRGSDGHRYVVTTATCVVGLPGRMIDLEAAYRPGRGPLVRLAGGGVVGELVAASAAKYLGEPGHPEFTQRRDVALVRLRRGVAADPAVCGLRRPLTLHRRKTSTPEVAEASIGHDTDRVRQLVLPHGVDDEHVVYGAAAPPQPRPLGEQFAGAPVLLGDAALGTLTEGSARTYWQLLPTKPQHGYAVSLLAPALAHLSGALRITLALEV